MVCFYFICIYFFLALYRAAKEMAETFVIKKKKKLNC